MKDEVLQEILAVIERLGATEMTARIVYTLVEAAVKKRGGRPQNGFDEGLRKPQANLGETSSRLSGSSLDLFPGSPDPQKPNQRERELDEPPRTLTVVKPDAFTVALEQFKAAWGARYGVEYCETGKDRNQLGRLIKGKTPAELAALPGCFAVYLNDLSPFVAQDRRHDLAFFCTSGGFNKYRAKAPILSRSEAQTMAAGEQWEAMHNGKG